MNDGYKVLSDSNQPLNRGLSFPLQSAIQSRVTGMTGRHMAPNVIDRLLPVDLISDCVGPIEGERSLATLHDFVVDTYLGRESCCACSLFNWRLNLTCVVQTCQSGSGDRGPNSSSYRPFFGTQLRRDWEVGRPAPQIDARSVSRWWARAGTSGGLRYLLNDRLECFFFFLLASRTASAMINLHLRNFNLDADGRVLQSEG